MSNLYNIGGSNQLPATPSKDQPVAVAKSNSTGESLPLESETPTLSVNTEKLSQSLDKVAEQLTQYATAFQRNLSFSVNQDTGDTVIVVSDSETKEVVRQIPSEFALQLAQNLNRLQETLDVEPQSLDNLFAGAGAKGNLFDANV